MIVLDLVVQVLNLLLQGGMEQHGQQDRTWELGDRQVELEFLRML